MTSTAADRDGSTAELGIAKQLHGRIERVHVEMSDQALLRGVEIGHGVRHDSLQTAGKSDSDAQSADRRDARVGPVRQSRSDFVGGQRAAQQKSLDHVAAERT